MNEIQKINELINLCNEYRNAYYNHQPLVSDNVYDRYFDELAALEKENNYYMANSPTQSVGYEVVDSLPKVKHDIPLLSLDKTKSISDVVSFAGNRTVLSMIKCDGLTTKLVYKTDGKYAELTEASTRGNGEVGSLVTHNVKTFVNIPLKIKYDKDLTVVGESIILKDELDKINATLPANEQYANCRNLASGSLSLLDSKECAKRHMRFLLFDVIKGMNEIGSLKERFIKAKGLGFEPVYFEVVNNCSEGNFQKVIDSIHKNADTNGIPCDGVVIRFDDYEYGKSLGRTRHHYKYGIAKKEEDGLVETIFRGIEWNTSRNGIVVPTGLFDEITILDSKISRATLHNLNYIDSLKLKIGDRICCSKRNMVIPAIEVNLDYNPENYKLPLIDKCPACGTKLEIKKSENSSMLYCPNDDCSAKKLSRFTHFVSKPCMNIDGLSEATLEKLINLGYISKFADIYHLSDHKEELEMMDGFGKKSVSNLLTSIENSRNVKLENYLNALGVPGIGLSAAKTISKKFNGDHFDFINALSNNYDFSLLEDFGDVTNSNLHTWWDSKESIIELLPMELNFIKEEVKAVENDFINGKTFVVTGAFVSMKRSEIEKIISERGGKLSSSVSSKTNYLLTNDIGSGSTKAKKALELDIPIMSEEEFLEKVGM